jgi:D-alanine-D-alanine ligase
VLGNQPRRILPLQEVDFSLLPDRPPIVSEHTRREAQSGEYQLMIAGPTAPIPEPVFARIGEVARQAFDLMEFRDYGRIDIRLSQNGTPYVIDLNPNCDLSDGASYCRAGQLAGLSYDQLIEEIALSAIKRSAHAHVQRHRSDPGASRDLAGVA